MYDKWTGLCSKCFDGDTCQHEYRTSFANPWCLQSRAIKANIAQEDDSLFYQNIEMNDKIDSVINKINQLIDLLK